MENPLHEALHYRKEPESRVVCDLCPHNCRIAPGADGICGVRGNRDGILYARTYGRVATTHMDPIEKKPLYHFMPGENILSVGTTGCNLQCTFCQNWDLVQSAIPSGYTSPEKLVNQTLDHRSMGIAYTYNEPGIWFEYLMDCAKCAHDAGLKNVLVTNGFLSPEPWSAICTVADAMNIDLKSIDPRFYRSLCKGALEPVLENIKTAAAACHIEVTNLIVTGENDSHDNIEALIDFIAGVNDAIPLHFSRYFPQNKMTAPATSPETLKWAVATARKKLKYVYAGNIALPNASDTICPGCDAPVIRRNGYRTNTSGLADGACSACGRPMEIVVS